MDSLIDEQIKDLVKRIDESVEEFEQGGGSADHLMAVSRLLDAKTLILKLKKELDSSLSESPIKQLNC